MKYMLLIYHNPGFLESFSEDDMSAVMKEVGEIMASSSVGRMGRRRGARRHVADEGRPRQ
jgi:hypothetical protein